MPRWLLFYLASDTKNAWRSIIQSFIALAIAGIYALIRIALFGGNSDTSLIECLLILAGSIILSYIIMKKLTKKK